MYAFPLAAAAALRVTAAATADGAAVCPVLTATDPAAALAVTAAGAIAWSCRTTGAGNEVVAVTAAGAAVAFPPADTDGAERRTPGRSRGPVLTATEDRGGSRTAAVRIRVTAATAAGSGGTP